MKKPKTPTVTFSEKNPGVILIGRAIERLLTDGKNTTVIAYISKDRTKFYLEPIALPSGAVVRRVVNANNGVNGTARVNVLSAFEGVKLAGRKSARWDEISSRLEIDLAAKSE